MHESTVSALEKSVHMYKESVWQFFLCCERDLFKRYTYLAPARSFFSFSSRSKHIVPPQGEDFPLALKQIYHIYASSFSYLSVCVLLLCCVAVKMQILR
jgi:hypothetical protein